MAEPTVSDGNKMRMQLIPLSGGDHLELRREVNILGRNEDCDLRVDHKNVSKQHCILVKTDGLILLRDLGSTNGTRVNGQRVRRAALVPNDLVSFASVQFRVQFQDKPNDKVLDQMHQTNLDKTYKSRLGEDAATLPTDAARVEIHTSDLPDVYPDDYREPSK